MSLRIIRFATLALSIAAISAVSAYAQNVPVLRVHVPFDFKAGGKDFASGDYRLRQADTGVITLESDGKQQRAFLSPITTLARSTHSDLLLVFDNVGDNRVLSEVWFPNRDGALVHVERGKHEHSVVRLVTSTAQAEQKPRKEPRTN